MEMVRSRWLLLLIQQKLKYCHKGLIRPGDRVVTTVLEHNSVLRPLYEMESWEQSWSSLAVRRQKKMLMKEEKNRVKRLGSWITELYRRQSLRGPGQWS